MNLKPIAESLAVSAGLITAATCAAIIAVQFPTDVGPNATFVLGLASLLGTFGIATLVTVVVFSAIDGGKP